MKLHYDEPRIQARSEDNVLDLNPALLLSANGCRRCFVDRLYPCPLMQVCLCSSLTELVGGLYAFPIRDPNSKVLQRLRNTDPSPQRKIECAY